MYLDLCKNNPNNTFAISNKNLREKREFAHISSWQQEETLALKSFQINLQM